MSFFQMIFDLTAKKLIGYEPSKSSESLMKNFTAFIRGLISFPLNIPGTAYHECMEVCPIAHAPISLQQL
jgi:hypothetical protein